MESGASNMDLNTELKRCEVEILEAFIKACAELKIGYYLMGGTMLGAIRHKGFIPWDDDIDVGMLRNDYDIFLEKGQLLLPSHMFLQTHKTDPEFPGAFAKIRNSNTTFIEASMRSRNINHGVWIDIFPLDYYPDDPKKGKLMRKKWNRYSYRIGQACFSKVSQASNSSIKKKIIRTCRGLIYNLMMPDVEETIQKRESLIKKAKQSSWLANWSGAWGMKEVVPSEWYGSGTMREFEGIMCRVPTEYEKWLSQVYGNYMELPPVEKRVTHHYSEGIDLHMPYTEYIDTHR